eukprot:TRINITY_DN66092_c0_g1_i1.p1 TRINITY_DN66092_c0_g1~~TRINITY_DN66092_c0_g1_i1.p1  ORF type:complete len:543 (+),score=12.69 TRINITY_DN66092_c0_g1_i1:114-1742(+)
MTSSSSSCESSDGEPAPQLCLGLPVWPTHWGITHGQVRELLERLRRDPCWKSENTLYTLVDEFIVPWTKRSGMGYALLVNKYSPKEVNVMISHAFAEHAEEFLETVLRATQENDVMYICALSNYQAEDGMGPSISQQLGEDPANSPFHRVLEHIALRGSQAGWRWQLRPILIRLPALLFLAALCFLWLSLAESVWTSKGWLSENGWYISIGLGIMSVLAQRWVRSWPPRCHGRMIVVPNRQVDIYTRLWCVYEMFTAESLGIYIEVAPTMAVAGKISSRLATCSMECDRIRIRADIEPFGFDRIDNAVKRTLRGVRWHTIGTFVKYIIIQVVPYRLYVQLIIPKMDAYAWSVTGVYVLMVVVAYRTARSCQGVFVARWYAIWAAVGILLGSVSFDLYGSTTIMFANVFINIGGLCALELAGGALVFLLALIRPFPACLRGKFRLLVMLVCFALTFACQTATDGISRRGLQLCFYLAWIMSVPIYTFWTESLHFGIRVKRADCSSSVTQVAVLIGILAWIFDRLSPVLSLLFEWIPVNESETQ